MPDTIFEVPGTLERPPMRIVARSVDKFPANASVGDLVTFVDGDVYVWNGVGWQKVGRGAVSQMGT